MAARGLVTFVATKVTKKAFSRKASFAARCLCPANQAKPGLQTIALFLPLKALAWQNLPCPSCTPGHHCFA